MPRPDPARLPILERDVLKSCMDLLALYPNIYARRQNTGAFAGEYKGRKRFVRFGTPGAGDIIAVGPAGLYIEIEVKVPGKGLRPEQAVHAGWVRKMGGAFIVAHSVEELQEALKAEGIRPGRAR